MLGYARHDRPPVDAGVDHELEQLFRLGDLFGLENRRRANVHFLEVVERYAFFLRFGPASRLAGHVGLFRVGELPQLGFDHAVVDLLEQQHGFADPVSGLEQRRVAELLPAQLADLQQAENLCGRERHERLDGDRD